MVLLIVCLIVGGLFWVNGDQLGDDEPKTVSVNVPGEGSEEVKGEVYESIVVFRNDDITGASKSFLEVNDVFVDNDVPVTHGVIPKSFNESNEDLEAECQKLQELKSENPGVVHFSVHGWNHNGLEFKHAEWNEINDKLEKIEGFGQECLDKEFEVFVAPHNSMSSEGRILLNESGYNVISADRKMSWQTADSKITGNRTEFLQERPLELGQSSMMVDRWDTDPVTFRNISDLEQDFNESIEDNEIFVQTVHHSAVHDNNKIRELEALIDYMDERDVYFASLGEIASLFEEDKIRRVDKGWLLIE